MSAPLLVRRLACTANVAGRAGLMSVPGAFAGVEVRRLHVAGRGGVARARRLGAGRRLGAKPGVAQEHYCQRGAGRTGGRALCRSAVTIVGSTAVHPGWVWDVARAF